MKWVWIDIAAHPQLNFNKILLNEVASPIGLVVSWRSPRPAYYSQCCKLSSQKWLINDDDDDDDDDDNDDDDDDKKKSLNMVKKQKSGPL